MEKTTQCKYREGVAIGTVMRIEGGRPFVVFPGNKSEIAIEATTIVRLDGSDIGTSVALSFEDGNPGKPIILGRILRDSQMPAFEVTTDDEPPQPLDLTSQKELTLRCGKASITLTKEGKIILRGTYISSRSSGPNRIKGGSVHLN